MCGAPEVLFAYATIYIRRISGADIELNQNQSSRSEWKCSHGKCYLCVMSYLLRNLLNHYGIWDCDALFLLSISMYLGMKNHFILNWYKHMNRMSHHNDILILWLIDILCEIPMIVHSTLNRLKSHRRLSKECRIFRQNYIQNERFLVALLHG